MGKKLKVVARMTLSQRGTSKRMIVEVHEGASFQQFYSWYMQEGRKRKKFVRTSPRNDGLAFTRAQGKSGLDVLADRQQSFNRTIESVTIKVFQKRMYNAMLQSRPESLGKGLPIAQSQGLRPAPSASASIAVQLPATYTPLQKRMDLLIGASA